MILISHRGNLNGRNPEMENNPTYIDRALKAGYNVEIDVRYVAGKWYLGHDEPQHLVNWDYLLNSKLWCHAKNIEALKIMLVLGMHCFWHQNDDVTLTSRGYIWTFPGRRLTENSICVMPEMNGGIKPNEAAGICSDYIDLYKEWVLNV
jgi:hypothetical protein